MKHTKIILALIAVLNMTATTMAQTTPTGRFEWAKGYTSSEDACHIIGTVTDSVGNLYILGQYNDYRRWPLYVGFGWSSAGHLLTHTAHR